MMDHDYKLKPRSTRLGHFILVLVAFWTFVIAGFTFQNAYHIKKTTWELATKEARTIFNKDQAFRFWATNHGGVYVSTDERTPPNPNLAHIPERDITTLLGKKLTLVNPAYMLRQIQEEFTALYKVGGHITSLKPLIQKNAPDAWERKTLEAFERGVKEVSEFSDINGELYLRLMLPLRVKKGCLKCHGIQGYKEGDVRGGISVSVPMTPYLAQEYRDIIQTVLPHIIIWLIGLCFIGIGYRGMSIRINERELAEEALRQSEEIHRAVTNSVWDSIVIVQDAKVMWANKVAFDKTGYSEDEFIGLNFQKIIHSDDLPGAIQRHQDRMFGKPVEDPSYLRVITKDGKIMEAENRGAIITWAGKPASVQTLRDITEEKRKEKEKKKMEAQLQQAQKMEAIGTLAGGIAHDFNNILTTIIGNASLALMEVGKDGSLLEELEEIKIAGERAATLTRQLLAFSRKQIIQPEILDLNEPLTDIEKMLGRLIGEDVEILIIQESALWQVETDPGQMEQVIMNLVVNARDAMPKGGKLTVETANVDLDKSYFRKHAIKEDQPGSYVMLAVSDTGIGMDKETQEHIFEPFFTTKEIGRGTGLGLSTVYGIVKQNNGFIWTYSEPGQGTTFKVYLPKAKGDVASEKKEQHFVAELGGSETVLIAEDDDSLRKLARTVLKQRGYKVLEAKNGEETLKVSEEHDGSIDLLITDVVMPKMSGKETAERLQPLYPQMKVIYMSGYTDDAIVHHGVLAPGLNFLEKPFSPEGLARKVREILNAG